MRLNSEDLSKSFSSVSYLIENVLNSREQREAELALQSGDQDKIEAIQNSKDDIKLAALVKAAMRLGPLKLALDTLELLACVEKHNLLHVAAEQGHMNICQLLVDQYQQDIAAFDEEGRSPIHYAANSGHLEILRYFHLECGGDINASRNNQEPWTPLMEAVTAFQLETVKYLLRHKANTAPVSFSNTALHIATNRNQVECIRLLLEHGAMVDPLQGLKDRQTPLHLACNQGHLEAAQALLDYGADPNARNGRGEMPLHLASHAKSKTVLALLLNKGALVESVDCEGRSALHHLINSKEKGPGLECMDLLLHHGANINQMDNNGFSPLALAAVGQKSRFLEYLIHHDADLCLRNNSKQTGIQFAMKYLPRATVTAVQSRLDKSLQMKPMEGDLESEVILDLEVLLPPASVNSNHPRSEVELFEQYLRFGYDGLEPFILHPLSQCYLHMKWDQIKKYYLIITVLSHFIYCLIYSTYSILVFRTLCPYDYEYCQFKSASRLTRDVASASWIAMVTFTFVYVIKESTNIWLRGWNYFKTLDSWGDIMCNLCFILTSFHSDPFSEYVQMAPYQYFVNGFGVFFAWVVQMLKVGRMPQFGLYVEVFKTVFWTFLNVMMTFFFVYVAFAVSLVVLFPKVPSLNSLSVLIKVLVMMLGEIEYEDLFFPDAQNTTVTETFMNGTTKAKIVLSHGVDYPVASHIMFILIILTVSFVIMNLLIGLSVSDVQVRIYKKKRKFCQSTANCLLLNGLF